MSLCSIVNYLIKKRNFDIKQTLSFNWFLIYVWWFHRKNMDQNIIWYLKKKYKKKLIENENKIDDKELMGYS